jgi:murein DD-endopeptidase MepM/ murein hydrolase activator NlpD
MPLGRSQQYCSGHRSGAEAYARAITPTRAPYWRSSGNFLRATAMKFPLPYVPTTTYKGENGFGGNRDKVRKGLRNAANDLAAPPSTPVLAMDDGVVISKPYSFYPKEGPLITWAL